MQTPEATFHMAECIKHLEALMRASQEAKQEIQASNLIERLGTMEAKQDELEKRIKKLEGK